MRRKEVADASPEWRRLPPVSSSGVVADTDAEPPGRIGDGLDEGWGGGCAVEAEDGATASNRRFMASAVVSFAPLAELEERALACSKASLPFARLAQHTKVYRSALTSSSCFSENLTAFTSGFISGAKKAMARA